MDNIQLNSKVFSHKIERSRKLNQTNVPTLLLCLAVVCSFTLIVLSNIPGYHLIFRFVALSYICLYLLYICLKRIKFVKPDALYFIFIIWGIFGLIGSYDTLTLAPVYARLWTLLQLILLSYFLYALALNAGTIVWLQWTCIVGVFVTMAWVFLETGGSFGIERISGTQGNANLFSFVLLFSLVISVYFLKYYSNIVVKITLLLNIALIFPFLLATGSRKGIIGFFVILSFVMGCNIFYGNRDKRLKSFVLAVFLFILTAAVLLPMLTQSAFFARVQNLERFIKGQKLVIQEQSLEHRMDLYSRGFQLALKRPFFGVGHDQFRYYDSTLRRGTFAYAYSHSNIIEVLANTGFVGFIIYYSAYLLIAVRIFTLWNKNNSELIRTYLFFVLMIGILTTTYDFFAVTYYGKEYWLSLTMVCSTLKLAQRMKSTESGSVS